MGSLLWILSTAFWIWMLVDCVQNERDRLWLYLVIFLGPVGGLAYAIVRWLPRSPLLQLPAFTKQRRQEELWQAEAAARNIGNAHQFVTLGAILLDMGELERAERAYQQAIEKEPKNVQALWGLACIEQKKGQLVTASQYLKRLLELDPNHRYGDASLIYGQILVDLKDLAAAETHLKEHLRSWRQPEAYLMMAEVQHQQGHREQACETLETMVTNLRGGPRYHYQKHRQLIVQAEQQIQTWRKAS